MAVSRAVKKLVDGGFLKSAVCKEDARRSRLSITAKGRRAYKAVIPAATRFEKKILSGLKKAEKLELARLLDRVLGSVDRLAESDESLHD